MTTGMLTPVILRSDPASRPAVYRSQDRATFVFPGDAPAADLVQRSRAPVTDVGNCVDPANAGAR